MDKAVLFVSAGLEAIPGIRLARQMGLHTVVSDLNPLAPGFAEADAGIVASTYDAEATVAEALRYHRDVRRLDGVLSVGADVPLTVAKVAAALDSPGISLEAARLASDKLAMKDCFRAAGVPIPWYAPVESAAHLREIVSGQGYPLVLKPVDSRGARGVLRLLPGVDLEWAYRHARESSPTGRVMVERFLSGPQISTESLVLDGVMFTPGFSDRNYEYLERFAPHIIENGGQLPGYLDQRSRDLILEMLPATAASLGVLNGVIKGDIVVHEGKPFVIEVAARLSGGYFCTHEIPLNTGVDLVGSAIRLALGLPVIPADLMPRKNVPVAQRYWFPDPGHIVGIGDPGPFLNHPRVHLLELRKRVGERIRKMDSHPDRAGVVITTGETLDEAVALAEHVVESVKFEVEPELCG
jgi:biotin carboxylase